MNLLTDQWIPAIRQNSSETVKISPAEIVSQIQENPVMRIDAPRPDFNGALIQFLIGLVQTVMTPKDEDEWVELFLEPPSVDDIQNKLSGIEKFFNLDTGDVRFMQEMGLPEDKLNSIAGLFIDSPGDNTLKENRDHFIKRGTIQKVCPSCTASALFTINTNAPAGGAGIRTSLRGGGPVTTLAEPISNQNDHNTLWHTIWLNILLNDELSFSGCNVEKKSEQVFFPWIVPVQTSEKKGTEVTPDTVHPFHIYWSMPRRIKLGQTEQIDGICDICGDQGAGFYTDYYTKPYGINYGDGFLHPLSPYYVDKQGLKLPEHPQPGGFTFRHWPHYVLSNDTSTSFRALVLQVLNKRVELLSDELSGFSPGVHVFGYDMDNMKARCWYETEMPYWHVSDDPQVYNDFLIEANQFVEVARQVARNTQSHIKDAWTNPNRKVKGDLSFIGTEFWNNTDSRFYQMMVKVLEYIKNKEVTPNELKEEWLRFLNRDSLKLYDKYAEQISLDNGHIDYYNNGQMVPRVIAARSQLISYNLGRNMRRLLNLPENQQQAS